jgi:hypothetical protein
MEIRDNMNVATDLINQAEALRAQLAREGDLSQDDAAAKAAKAKAADLDKRILAIESKLFNMTSTGRGQDQLRFPSQLVEKLSHLADVVSLNDFAPTDQELAVHKKLTQELSGYQEVMKPLLVVR